MRAVQNAVTTCAAKETSQFEITSNTITKLNTFKLTPTAKLVLLYLTTCYNPKHKEVFPKQKTIADKLGISERSVTRAIQELFKEGLVLIECKHTNRYKFTSRIVQEQAGILSDDLGQNDTQQTDNLSDPYIHEQTIEHDNKQTVLNRGSNVCQGDDEILADYAIKHNAKSVQAYINKLKETGSANKIIKEYKAKNYATKRALRYIEETQSLIKNYEVMKIDCVTAAECGYSLKDIFAKKKALIKG